MGVSVWGFVFYAISEGELRLSKLDPFELLFRTGVGYVCLKFTISRFVFQHCSLEGHFKFIFYVRVPGSCVQWPEEGVGSHGNWSSRWL